MGESIEEDNESPPHPSRLFKPCNNQNFMKSNKGKVFFHPEVISDMHEQVLRNNKEELKQLI